MFPDHNTNALLLRRSDVFRLAEHYRMQFAHLSLMEIAERFDIHLLREDGREGGPDGVAVIEPILRPIAIESLATPGTQIPIWGGRARQELKIILINRSSRLPEREIWWHEFYHIMNSPRVVARSVHSFDSTSHEYRVEERRADDFTAAMLVPDLRGVSSLDDVVERFDVSKRLARHAIELHAALGRTSAW
jgi:hypothetical protein